jgi:transcriptional regulator
VSKQEAIPDRLSLLQGSLHLLVLRVLAAGPLHGYGISRRLADLSDDWLQVDEGSLYPCLYRMEKRGWIVSETRLSENKRKARFYSLTGAGVEQLGREIGNWSSFNRVVMNVLNRA